MKSFLFGMACGSALTAMLFSSPFWEENNNNTALKSKAPAQTNKMIDDTAAGDAHLLEDLLYKYKSDKSHDDHKYSDAYQAIFRPIRREIRNMTEIGVNAGQSMQAFYHYFPNADIYGYDNAKTPSIDKILAQMGDRIHYTETKTFLDVHQDRLEAEMGLAEESMDIILEDASHHPDQQEAFFNLCWKLVRPGGYYIIEDIRMMGKGLRWWTRPEQLKNLTAHLITHEFDSFLVDTTIGHRDFPEWIQRTKPWALGRPDHNSYALLLRRRTKPLPNDVQMFFKNGAMDSASVVYD